MQSIKQEVPIYEKLLLTKEEAAEYSHVGINKLEELLKVPNCTPLFWLMIPDMTLSKLYLYPHQ